MDKENKKKNYTVLKKKKTTTHIFGIINDRNVIVNKKKSFNKNLYEEINSINKKN